MLLWFLKVDCRLKVNVRCFSFGIIVILGLYYHVIVSIYVTKLLGHLTYKSSLFCVAQDDSDL